VVNLECKELVYVLKDEGEIVVEGKTVHFSKGDMILLLPSEIYYWHAECAIVTVCTPAFNPDQHKMVE
jgi:hypothetical protein